MSMDELLGKQSQRGAEKQIPGVMIGIVTDNKDPDQLGRVKLKLPLLESQHETDWVPLTSLMSGKDMGTLFIPEVDDEVLVAFLQGQMDSPVVIGSLWNQQKKPPAKDQNNDIRKIKSRHGHELIFQDKAADAKVTLKTKDGHKLEIEDKTDKLTLTTSDNQKQITIAGGSENTITVKVGANKITIAQTGDIQISGTKAVTVKGTQVKVEASATLDLKAAVLNLKADGIVTIKGSMVKIN